MAECVELLAEEIIPELEHLKRLRLFDESEIRTIIKTRKYHQLKMQKRKKCMGDYVRYIQYEMDLMMLIKTRRIKMGLTDKKYDVDMIIANRVNKLYEQAIFRFHDNIDLWLSYMKFSKQVKVFSVCVSNMLVGMLAVHSHKPSLWKLAATWEYEENNSIENACQFLIRGLRHHPNSKLLYTEAFRMELLSVDMKHRKKLVAQGTNVRQEMNSSAYIGVSTPSGSNSFQGSNSACQLPESMQWQYSDPALAASSNAQSDDSSDYVTDLHQVEVIYENASKKVPNVQFLIDLLDIAKKFDFTEKLQARMAKDLLSWFPNDELTWDTLARRELEGLHFFMDRPNSEEEYRECMDQEDGPSQKSDSEKIESMRIRHCLTIYQHGLQYLGTTHMWEMYLDTLIEINQDLNTLAKWKRKLLLSAFQKAHEESRLHEKYYIYWAGLLSGQKEELSFVLDVATTRFPSSLLLWEMYLRFHLSQDEEEKAMAIFKHAISTCHCEDGSTISLWKMLIQYYQIKNMEKVKEVFEEGVKQTPAVSSVLKQMYLEWLVLAKNITAARQVYQSLCDKPPFCRELHHKMAELECMQPDVQLPRVLKCFELAVKQFGKHNTDVWKDYAKFEIKRGDLKKVKEIYLRALKVLDEEHAHNFIGEFCEFFVVKPSVQGSS